LLTPDQENALNNIPFDEEPESKPEAVEVEKEQSKTLPPATNNTVLDSLELEEAIFTGGPTRSEIEAMKKQYPHADIMCSLLATGKGVVYRTMTRSEWKNIQQLVRSMDDPDQKEEVIFSKIVLFPNCQDRSVINNLPAGVVQNTLNEFYTYSGFTPVAESMKL
jgi:hypothetical protein